MSTSGRSRDSEPSSEQALQTHSSYHCEFRVVWADGSVHWIEGRGQALYDEAGQPVRMTGTVMAIDERKQGEAALQEREAILRLFAQYAPAGIAMLDGDMRYMMASQRWVDDHYLDSIESLINRSHYEVFPEVPERWRQIHQRCLEKVRVRKLIRNDGTFPGQEIGATLAKKGDVRYVVSIGTYLQSSYIYAVHFLQAGFVVGCRKKELESAEEVK